MKPDVFGVRIQAFADDPERFMLATPHLSHLLIEKGVDEDT